MSDLIETTLYDPSSDTFAIKTSYDSSSVIAHNIATKNLAQETGRYKGNLVKVASIHEGDVLRLRNAGFNLMSSDPDEVKRCLLHIQANEPHLLTMPGTPIGKKKTQWV